MSKHAGMGPAFIVPMVHVIKNPAGSFSLVGLVPASLCDAKEPTTADVLAGRVQGDGKVYRPRVFQDGAEAFAAIDASGNGCDLPACACAALRAEVSRG